MNSIRRRLLIGLVASLTVLFSLGGFTLERAMKRSLVAELDRSLRADFRSNAAAITAGVMRRAPEAGRQDRPGDRRPRRFEPNRPGERRPLRALSFVDPEVNPDFVFQAWSDGHTFASEALEGALPSPDPDEPAVPFDDIDAQELDTRWVELADGRQGRALLVRYNPPLPPGAPPGARPPRETIELSLARDASGALGALGELRRLLAWTWAIGTLASILVVRFALDRGLRPLSTLRTALGEMDAKRLNERFPSEDSPVELRPIVERLNGLLERLDEAFGRERAFTSDVAHELRTPLAGLSSTLEVALRRQRTPEEQTEAARQSLAITREMQALVEKLLDLARSGAKSFAGDEEEVELADRIRAHIEAQAETSTEREVSWSDDLEALTVRLDGEALDRILGNLCENAARYADRGSLVEVRLARKGEGARLSLTNWADGLPADAGERAFDPFWRADVARTEAVLHAGIGLSLCQRIAERLGLEMSASYKGGKFEVVVVFAGSVCSFPRAAG